MEIHISSLFERRFKKLPREIKQKAVAREKIFVVNPFDSRLGTHKLHGEKRDEWAYSVDYSYRIVFIFLENNAVLYLNIGTHDELY